MNTEHFIARRILKGKKGEKQFTRPVIRISVLGISLGLGVMILTLAVVTGFQKEIRDKVAGFGSHIQVSRFDNNESYEPSPVVADPEMASEIRKIPGVVHIQEYAQKAAIIKANQEMEGIVLKGIGPDFDTTFFAENILEGRICKVGTGSESREIVISALLAKRLKLSLGDSIPLFFLQNQKQRARKFVVRGIYETGLGGQFDDLMVLGDIKMVRLMSDWTENEIAGYELFVNDFKKLDYITETVNSIIPYDLKAYSITQVYQTIFSWLNAQDVNALVIIILMLAVCIINMISVLLIIILERTRMIGIIKALGFSNFQVRKVFLINSGYLIARGLFWGNLIGIGFCLLQLYTGFLSLDPESYFLSKVPVNLSWEWIVGANVLTALACLASLLLPSYLITRITPVRAIRFN
jgi:lipoprotein-releasing system permease protein